jgi:hypothetical protein
MTAQTLLVDGATATITLRTRAEGLLARLAHDLELTGADLTGTVTLDGTTWKATLSLPVASLRVAGALHGETLDKGTLSASDRAKIEAKMREDVFFGGAPAVSATAQGASLTSGEATISIGSRSQRVPITLDVALTADAPTRATGRFTLSLEKLGVKPIKAPLGAFRVKDAVEVLFTIPLRAEPEGEGN